MTRGLTTLWVHFLPIPQRTLALAPAFPFCAHPSRLVASAGEDLVPEPSLEVQEDAQSLAAARPGWQRIGPGQPGHAADATDAARDARERVAALRRPAARAHERRAFDAGQQSGLDAHPEPAGHESADHILGHGSPRQSRCHGQQLHSSILMVPSRTRPFHELAIVNVTQARHQHTSTRLADHQHSHTH